jgi:sulfite reductase (NADPH) flavoprotein alpha-component
MEMSPIPKTAPFAEEEIDLLNRVVGTASPIQRAWLAGFLAGLDASGGMPAVHPAAPARPAEPLTIVYASESGNSEKLAGDIAKAARKNGLKPTVIDMADLDLAALTAAKKLVVIAATWGEGDPPARAVRVYNELMGEGAPRLDGVEFGVLALGDTAYAEFCLVGRKIDERLAALGGKRVIDRIDLDLDFAEPAARWIGDAEGANPAECRRPRHRSRFRRQAQRAGEHRYRRSRDHRAYRPEFLALGQGNYPSGAFVRERRAGL